VHTTGPNAQVVDAAACHGAAFGELAHALRERAESRLDRMEAKLDSFTLALALMDDNKSSIVSAHEDLDVVEQTPVATIASTDKTPSVGKTEVRQPQRRRQRR